MIAETGHFGSAGGAATLDVRVLAERLRELTGEAIARRRRVSPGEREAIERYERQLDVATVALRDIGERLLGPEAADRAARLDLAAELARAADAAVAAALALGFHHRGGPEAVAEAEAAGRGQGPAKARERRLQNKRMDDIRAVIDRHAVAHFRRYPDDAGNADRIARAIADPVARDVQGIAGIKPPWRATVLPLVGRDHERCVQRIRKQLRLCPCWTTVSHP